MENRIQQQQLGGGIPKPAQRSEAVGYDREGTRKYRSNSAGPGINVKGGDSVGVALWKLDLGGDQEDVQGPDSISPSVGATDHGDDGKTWGRWRVGVSRGRGGNGIRGDPPHRSIHQEVADDHIVEGGISACIFIVHGVGEDSRDDPDGVMVGSRRVK